MGSDLYKDFYWTKMSCSKHRNYQVLGDNSLRFSCPLCGDSDKDETKARGNVYKSSKGILKYKCFNCGEGPMHISQLLKRTDQQTYKSYIFDIYSDERKRKARKAKKLSNPPKIKKLSEEKTPEITLNKAVNNSIALDYLKSRQIPEEKWKHFYYSSNFIDYINDEFNYGVKNSPKEDKRIVLKGTYNGHLIGFIARSLDKYNKLRYVNAKIDKDYDILPFGFDELDKNKVVYGVEGAIDSLFVDNGVSINSSALTTLSKQIDKNKLVLIWDNEPRNKEICKLIKKAINNKYSVVIWPNNIKQKDLNDMILSGITYEKLQHIIKRNTFKGLEAQLKFNNWCKVKF